MRQAHMTAHDYMTHAIEDIDSMLGKGYAKDHPELIAAYMQTAATDFGAACVAKEIRQGLDEIAASIDADKIADSLKDVAGAIQSAAEHLVSYGDQDNGSDRIAEAVQNIAAMLDLFTAAAAPLLPGPIHRELILLEQTQ
jgi:hypothetical protein